MTLGPSRRRLDRDSAAGCRDEADGHAPVVCPRSAAAEVEQSRRLAAGFGFGRIAGRSGDQLREQSAYRRDLDRRENRSRRRSKKSCPDAKPEVVSRSSSWIGAPRGGHRWTLTAKDSPLARVDSLLKYEIQVADIDGLRLPHPIEGSIRIKPDRPPTVLASAARRAILPRRTRRVPEVNYIANDDYGISQLRLYVEVIHPGRHRTASAGDQADFARSRATGQAGAQTEPAAHRHLSPPLGAI